MKHRLLPIFTLIILVGYGAPSRHLSPVGREPQPILQSDKPTPEEKALGDRDLRHNGIVVGVPKVYDNALLQKMLEDAESRLAQLRLLDASEIAKRLGSVTGAEQSISSSGFNVQGPSIPGVQTKTTAAGTEETVTLEQANPPAATAPAPTTGLPSSSSFSVSSSDILNEQMQLTSEIAGLRLLLAGSLSDHFIDGAAFSPESSAKLKTTLGFPITIVPDKRHKEAVAIVEVEVEKLSSVGADEPPAITALLPTEKTYNVASITDKSLSVQGGVVTHVVGIGGSFLRGRKTYYLVQDQDTVALSYQPEDQKRVGFMWQFRPVLGRDFIRSGQKQTFVQIAFPTEANAKKGEIGKVHVRTYWRKYDRKKGIVTAILPNSLKTNLRPFDIPRYSLKQAYVLNKSGVEDLGNGHILVRLEGRFLPGTSLRIGGTSPAFAVDYSGIRFIASAADLVTRKVALVAPDGTENTLIIEHTDTNPIGDRPVPKIASHQVTTNDDSSSMVTVKLENQVHITEDYPPLLMVIGGRAFGYSDAPIKRDKETKTLSVVVPTALLIASPEVLLKPIFAPTRTSCPGISGPCVYEARVSLSMYDAASRGERLILLEHGKDSKGKDSVKFLLQGSRLGDAEVINPKDVKLEDIGRPKDKNTLRVVTLTTDQIRANKFLLIQRKSTLSPSTTRAVKRPGSSPETPAEAQEDERPFLVAIPPLEPTPPKPPAAKERVTVNADEAVVEGDGMKELVSVKFNNTSIPFVVAKDGKSVTLKGLQSRGVTAAPTTQSVELEFKDGKATVKIEIVNSKVETVSK